MCAADLVCSFVPSCEHASDPGSSRTMDDNQPKGKSKDSRECLLREEDIDSFLDIDPAKTSLLGEKETVHCNCKLTTLDSGITLFKVGLGLFPVPRFRDIG